MTGQTNDQPPTEAMANLNVNPVAPKGTAKRDALRENEIQVQEMWARDRVFESDATDDGREKFIVTFPFPYSNGHLHIGHAFSLTKSVFRAQFERNLGKNVLFPFAFHCTGMPIQAVSEMEVIFCLRFTFVSAYSNHQPIIFIIIFYRLQTNLKLK